MLETLAQGEALLGQLSDSDYTRKLPVAFNAAIGGHYRHCLDHFRTLLDAVMQGDLNYDHRERGTMIECDRFRRVECHARIARMLRASAIRFF
ncbi:MAG: hypothetical protein QM813_05450 [Verrucomicrobiota bacterium]